MKDVRNKMMKGRKMMGKRRISRMSNMKGECNEKEVRV